MLFFSGGGGARSGALLPTTSKPKAHHHLCSKSSLSAPLLPLPRGPPLCLLPLLPPRPLPRRDAFAALFVLAFLRLGLPSPALPPRGRPPPAPARAEAAAASRTRSSRGRDHLRSHPTSAMVRGSCGPSAPVTADPRPDDSSALLPPPRGTSARRGRGGSSSSGAAAADELLVCLSAIAPALTCGICDGLLRDATAISDCLHAFCRQCIYEKLTESRKCPTCDLFWALLHWRSSESLDELVSTVPYRIGMDNGKPNIKLLYNDDEGDRVILTTVSDLTAAIEHAKSAGWKVLAAGPDEKRLG